MSFYLALVSPLDSPLFELPLTSSRPATHPHNSTAGTTAAFPSWSTFTGANGGDLDAKTAGPGVGMGLVEPPSAGAGAGGGERWLCQMVVHKSLDSVEEVLERSGGL